jgi:hypothetical protein
MSMSMCVSRSPCGPRAGRQLRHAGERKVAAAWLADRPASRPAGKHPLGGGRRPGRANCHCADIRFIGLFAMMVTIIHNNPSLFWYLG